MLVFKAPHYHLHLPPTNLHTYTTLSGTPANINAQPKQYFKAMIQAMDHEMGRLFDSLQVMNKLDSTDIIFIGDNGNTPRTAQIADTSKAKGTVYQYGIHVPMIIAGPSVVNPNRASDALVNTADIFATIVENFGFTNWKNQIPSNKHVDSKSLQPIIKNTTDSIRAWSFCELFKLTTDSSDGKAIRNRNYKLIRFDYGAEEFYNLATDPNETTNLMNRNLTATDISNYHFLCDSITALTGDGTCKPLSINNINQQKEFQAFPNPFTNHIYLSLKNKNEECQLINQMGEIIYSGKEIEQQDFSNLPNGIYFLRKKKDSIKFLKK